MNYNSIRLVFNKDRKVRGVMTWKGLEQGVPSKLKGAACAKALWLGAWYV